MRAAYGLVLSLLCMSAAGAAVAETATRADVLTAHADRQRTGWFSHEHKLTPATLAGAGSASSGSRLNSTGSRNIQPASTPHPSMWTG